MIQATYNFLSNFAELPINIWFYIFFLIAPLLVFSTKPRANSYLHSQILLAVIIIGYCLIILSVINSNYLDSMEYERCQAQFPDGYRVMHPECGSPWIGDGAQNAFAVLLGWVPSAAYVGFWELLWLWYYRKRIQELGKDFKCKWVSQLLIILSIPIWVYVSLLTIVIPILIYEKLIIPFINTLISI